MKTKPETHNTELDEKLYSIVQLNEYSDCILIPFELTNSLIEAFTQGIKLDWKTKNALISEEPIKNQDLTKITFKNRIWSTTVHIVTESRLKQCKTAALLHDNSIKVPSKKEK